MTMPSSEFSKTAAVSWHHRLSRSLFQSNRWLLNTPNRSLEQAYQAALKIKAIETEHFDGEPITAQTKRYQPIVLDYFQADLKKYLNVIKLRLAEFNVSRLALNYENPDLFEKITLIDTTVRPYRLEEIAIAQSLTRPFVPPKSADHSPPSQAAVAVESTPSLDHPGVLPRSIGRTVERIKTGLNPKAEGIVMEDFRRSQLRTKIAVRFFVLLLLVPLVTQQVSKRAVIRPLVDRWVPVTETNVFLNLEMKEEALQALQIFEEELKFDALMQNSPALTESALNQKLHHKVEEIVADSHNQGHNAISNVFADIAGTLAFAGVLLTRRRDLAIFKAFIDEIIYGLSDSAKAFFLILFTDMFVGFHSPHGWEVILEGLAKHLGIAANHSLIFLFIATVPVILDTVFKYWIFRYLSRLSPSAVATLRNMNE